MTTKVISVGGSLIAPKFICTHFLRDFRNVVNRHKDKKFIIVCGGGYTARTYQRAAGAFAARNEDKDWLGIFATYLNAKLMASALGAGKILTSPMEKIPQKRVVVASGWKPGRSTDYDAVILAKRANARGVINMTNVPYVYDKDPKKFRGAKPLKEISWKDYRKICGNEWKPGANLPFDPIASRLAQEAGIKVVILKGITNLKKCLEAGSFEGTIIK
ncbi:MAG: UMP kinase [Candidatus Aenigmarchaeota archaeon]|nr:UMP kinase [Candidatus Aenigmarchaeota archaeon]